MATPDEVAEWVSGNPQPPVEQHDMFGKHESFWLVASCGQSGHPMWWSCSICAERPVA